MEGSLEVLNSLLLMSYFQNYSIKKSVYITKSYLNILILTTKSYLVILILIGKVEIPKYDFVMYSNFVTYYDSFIFFFVKLKVNNIYKIKFFRIKSNWVTQNIPNMHIWLLKQEFQLFICVCQVAWIFFHENYFRVFIREYENLREIKQSEMRLV